MAQRALCASPGGYLGMARPDPASLSSSPLALSSLCSSFLFLFVSAYLFGACPRPATSQLLWSQDWATQSWALLPQFWDHPGGGRGELCPRPKPQRPRMIDSSFGSGPAGCPERGPMPTPAESSTKPPSSRKGALLSSSLHTHAMNSSSISIFHSGYE